MRLDSRQILGLDLNNSGLLTNFNELIHRATSWSIVHQALRLIAQRDKERAGYLFEEFCRYYFLAHPAVKREYKNVWYSKSAPLRIKKKLDLPLGRKEYGIDLILEGSNGKLTAVQCKFRSSQTDKISWTRDKLANLFAEGNHADYFIIFTNARDIDEHTKQKQKTSFQLICLSDLVLLSPDFFSSLKELVIGEKFRRVAPLTVRDHQKKAIKNVLEGFKKYDRGQLIHPCGAGKTFTALWIRERLDSKKVLVLVPSLALLRQFKTEWNTVQKRFTEYLCVCSDEDIDRLGDSTVVHTYEVSNRVSTKPSGIRQFLEANSRVVVFSTYQSLDAIRSAVKGTKIKFDLVICDEAHRTAGGKISEFGLIHSNKNIPAKKRLYMTATPRIISDKIKNRVGKEILKLLADMSDETLYGPVLDRMTFAEAINKNILVDYKIIGIGVSEVC